MRYKLLATLLCSTNHQSKDPGKFFLFLTDKEDTGLDKIFFKVSGTFIIVADYLSTLDEDSTFEIKDICNFVSNKSSSHNWEDLKKDDETILKCVNDLVELGALFNSEQTLSSIKEMIGSGKLDYTTEHRINKNYGQISRELLHVEGMESLDVFAASSAC